MSLDGSAKQRAGLREQIRRLPEVMRASHERLEDAARRILSTPEHHGLQLVVLTGCGDSAIAARGAAFAWQELAGVPAFALEAMTVARYHGRGNTSRRPGGQLLLAVSSSGSVARVVEAAQRSARHPGTIVCAATANDASPLAEAADRILDTTVPVGFQGPGLCSYVVGLLGLLHLAIRSGEVRGRYTMDEAASLRAMLQATADSVERTLAAAERPVRQLARSWEGYDSIELLGAGPARGSAAFGAAKILEAVGLAAMDQDVEEFMHLQYFERRANRIATVLISSPAFASYARAREVQGHLETLRRPHALLTAGRVAGVNALPHDPVNELFAPVVHAPVLAMLAAELADLHGELPGRGAVGQWADSKDGLAVRYREPEPATGSLHAD